MKLVVTLNNLNSVLTEITLGHKIINLLRWKGNHIQFVWELTKSFTFKCFSKPLLNDIFITQMK